MDSLPVDSLKPSIFSALDAGVRSFVISAPTGSGKSTRLPVMLSEKLGGKVLVLQPRRVAARMLARSVADIFNMPDAVGWHVRFDKHYGPDTKIVFLTEGILARMLLDNPKLPGVSAIVFDEFHERNIYADISLALAVRSRETMGADFAIAVCSASMDSDSLLGYLGPGAKKFECSGRLFPIETIYAPPRDQRTPIWELAARQFALMAGGGERGGFLIFMPGVYEIMRTISKISEYPVSKHFELLALYGDLPPERQDKVLAKSSKPKVIVSTNVAETSLTIDGISNVIDSGYARVARYDCSRGVNTLFSERESLASAAQRAGRAGRTAPGRAVRLWRSGDEAFFEPYTPSEISRLDLSQLRLWLKSASLDFSDLRLFEEPSEESLQRSIQTLTNLGALDSGAMVTSLGRKMARFPLEPRYARLLIEGGLRGCLGKTAMVAALTEAGRVKLDLSDVFDENERASMVGEVSSEAEEIAALCMLAKRNSFDEAFCRRYGIHAANARKALRLAGDFMRIAGIADKVPEQRDALAKCVLSAFSDHLCVRLGKGTLACAIVGGGRGEIVAGSRHYASDIFCALDLQERKSAQGAAVMASMIVPVRREYLEELFPGDFSSKTALCFDSGSKRIISRNIEIFRDLPVSERDSFDVPPDEAAKLFRDEILEGRLRLKNYGPEVENFIERLNFVALNFPEYGFQAIDEAAKSEIFEQMCYGKSSYSEVKNMEVLPAFCDWLSKEQMAMLKYLAPVEVAVNPNRRPVKISYDSKTCRAVISASFKDLYNFNPSRAVICGGKVSPTFEILAPNGRPIQTTQNLGDFWKSSWLNIRREVKARYPKHFKQGDPWYF